MEASSKELELELTGLTPGTTFIVETMDKDHGNVYDEYMKIGAPHSPNREETTYLKERAWGTLKETIRVSQDGTLKLKRDLLPWTCILIKEL
jgi:xylan 1,4-beta-xylosidase